MKKDYSNVEFPQIAKYIRHPNRIYCITDPKDGEVLTYYGKTEKSSSNSLGYRNYKTKDGTIKLVNWNDIEAIELGF